MTRYAALDRCIGAGAEFLAEYWGRQPLLRRGHASDAFADLLTLADVDDLVTSAGLRVPEFRLIKDGTPVPVSSYTTAPHISGVPLTGLADPRRVLAAVDDGATLVLQGMHRYRGAASAVPRLEVELGCPCQVNAYFTPPGARGLALHSDTHDVFVLQCFGRKRWEIHAPDAIWDVVLEPGDALYMPKGTPHAATAQHELSGHLTIGLVADSMRGVLAGSSTGRWPTTGSTPGFRPAGMTTRTCSRNDLAGAPRAHRPAGQVDPARSRRNGRSGS